MPAHTDNLLSAINRGFKVAASIAQLLQQDLRPEEIAAVQQVLPEQAAADPLVKGAALRTWKE